MHEEILIKVNAWVDKGVVPLVAALNEFKDIITTTSCENSSEKGYADVSFIDRYGDEHALANFILALSKALETRFPAHYGWTLRLETCLSSSGRSNGFYGRITVVGVQVPALAEALTAIALELRTSLV